MAYKMLNYITWIQERSDKQNIADRIFMGYHDLDKTHLISALKIAKKDLHHSFTSNCCHW